MAHALFKFIQFPRPKLRLSDFFPHRCSSNVRRACFAFHRYSWPAIIVRRGWALVNQFGSERLQLLHLFSAQTFEYT